ncbi:MAG: RHS repeat-associated core domain-containing protein [Taibaiella sp.]|jgi:RHS repeat-associated protein
MNRNINPKIKTSLRLLSVTALLLLLCAWGGTPVQAQAFDFRPTEASEKKTALQIKQHNGFMDTIIVRQDKWIEMVNNGPSWGSNLKFKSVHAFVKFYINHAYPVKIPEAYTFRLTYKVYGYGNMADTNAYTSFNDTLTISYKPDSLSSFQDLQYKKYSNFHKIMVVMTGLYKIDGAGGTPVAMDLSMAGPFSLLNFYVEGSILIQPYHKKVQTGSGYVSVYGTSAPAMNIDHDAVANDYLPVKWTVSGANLNSVLALTPVNYELEWTYVDNYKVNASTGAITTIPATSLPYNFKENSTRVWLDTNYYKIPMIYQKGYVLYRVRMVRPDSVQYRYPVYGAWSLANETGMVSSVGNTNMFEITQAHLSDSLNWQYTVSFAEQGKYKHVMSYYDGMLKNRQSITRFNSMPGKLIATEQVYDYEGRPSISLLPTPVTSGAFRYQFNLTLNGSTGLPYKAHDFDTLQGGVCPLDNVPSPLANASPANIYYSPLNPDKAGFQKFVPDAGGYPFVQTIYSPGYDERVEKQGGAGDSLQIGFNHNVKNDYVSADQMDLNRLFGTDIGWSGFYRKTVSRDPNGQLSLNVTDYKGKTVTSSMIGIPDTTIHSIVANENLPDTSFYQEDHIAGTTQQVLGNKIILDKNFFNDAGGNNLAQYIYTFKPFPTFCPGKYLTVAARYDYTIFDECGNIDLDTGGVLGISGVTSSGSPVTTSTAQIPFYMEKGKHSLHKELTINTDDVDVAVDQFMALSPAENCLKNEPWFIKEAVLSKEFPCPEEYNDMDCNSCEGKKFQMMQELWPNKDSVYMERKYGIYRQQGSGLVAGNNNSIFTIISGGGDLGPIVYRYQDPCMVQLPASVTKNGHTYTNLQSLPVDTFIYIFNDDIAEALLPMHPEYCELLKCFDDKYADKLRSIPDANIAEQLGLMSLTGMINGDPLYAKMLTLPSLYPNAFDTLAHFAAGISLDTMALIQAYCGCNDSTMFQDCRNNIFASQINGGILLNDYVKERYFETVRNLYIANRSRYLFNLSPVGALAACTTCQDVRMTLVPLPVFMTFTNPGGGLATGPGSLLGTLQTLNPVAAGNLSTYFTLLQTVNLDTLQQLNDSAYQVYTSNDSTLCAGAVDAIIVQLVNCAAPGGLNGLRNSLLALCQSGQVSGGYFTPDQIKTALQQNGLAINDICNQYLVNYDNNMDYSSALDQGGFTCNSDAFYNDAENTLNDPDVIGVLKNAATSATLNLSAGNQFQQELIAALGATSCTVSSTINTGTHVQTLTFANGAQTVNLYFKTAASGSCASPFITPPGEDIYIEVNCVNPPNGFANGYIGKYSFAIIVSHDFYTCNLQAWNDKIMMNHEGENPIAGCVPCTQMRSLANEFILYTMQQQFQVKGTDHPYFKTMFRNFCNYRLQKAYTEAQYMDFMESCALSDYMPIGRYATHVTKTFTNEADMFSFVNGANNLDPSIHLDALMYKFGTVQYQVDVNLNSAPKDKLRMLKNYFLTFPGISYNIPWANSVSPNTMGALFVKASSSFNPSSAIFGSSANPFFFTFFGTYDLWTGSSYEPTRIYGVKTPNVNAYSDNNRNANLLVKYIYDNGIDGVCYPSIHITYNSQHDLAEKQVYLQKAYSYLSMPINTVLDSLQAQFLEASVPIFNGKQLSYGHPAQPGNIQNLYVADPATATNNTHYSKLTYIIDKVRNYLPGNALFFAGGNTRNVPVPSGEILTAYRCRDTAFWYRYFGPGDTLYNVFIRIPAYIDTTYFAGYQFQGMTFNPGEGNSFSFTIGLKNINAPVKELVLNGFTDFVVAKNEVLRDVLIAHAVNEEIPVADTVNNCERQRLNAAIYEGRINYKIYIDSVRAKLRGDFYAYIMSSGIEEKLYVGYRNQRFNYTLYYYDRAGNLTRTIPPAGLATLAGNLLPAVDAARAANSGAYLPSHHKPSQYKYNTLNQVIDQETPDGGRTEYFYDAAGRAIFSQNAKQREAGRMTYTLYDRQGRIMETGQAKIACDPYFPPYPSPTDLGNNPCSYYVAGTITPFPPQVQDLKSYPHSDIVAYVRALNREEVVLTRYDKPALDLSAQAGMGAQDNLRKRVAAIKYFDYLTPADTAFNLYDYAMHFSYDIAGNVKTLTRDYPSWKAVHQQFKRVDYDYDVISGKVNLLSYNRGFADQYFQRYGYDGDNRITKVETSSDGYIWKHDAEYQYYQHGPLARMSLGDLRVQGVDYAYTIQGWLKAVNGDMLDTAKDMGADATGNSIHAKDAVALSLDYFKGDYRPIGTTAVTHIADPAKNMYNGNIPRATTSVAPFPSLNTNYVYDQLNRIIKAQYAYVNPYDGQLDNTADYYSKYAYDPDGNLQKLVRNGNSVGTGTQMMDSLEYKYPNGQNNNKLDNVLDYVSNTSFHNDIKHYTNAASSRYLYDATGNTIKDLVSGQDTILWNHYNKVTETRKDTSGHGLYFAYDGAGNRYLKTVSLNSGDTSKERSDYYVRDAQGNILAIYDMENGYKMTKTEWIEYITQQYIQEFGPGIVWDHVIGPYYGQVGYFKSSFLQQVLANSGYVTQEIDAHPLSYYVANSEVVKSNILAHTGGYADFYGSMRSWSQSNNQPLLGSALYNRLNSDKEANASFMDALLRENIDPVIRTHAMELMCLNADTLFKDATRGIGQLYDTNGCGANADALVNRFVQQPEAIHEFSSIVAQLATDPVYQNGYWNFVRSLSLDETVLGHPPYTSTTQQGVLIPYFEEALRTHSNSAAMGSFLDTWTPARALLKSTNDNNTLLQVAYDQSPAAFIGNFVTYTGNMQPVYYGLQNIPWLTGVYFIEKFAKIDTVGTIIHTVYENVLHSKRISLSSHHLYGSSRLGTKDYLAGQYYMLWDYSGPQTISDTATLLTRRPWYSREYNDVISGLALQPWGMTEMNAFLVSHQVGQKQYELTNHLGNVQATVSDLPSFYAANAGDTIRQHFPALVTAYDYYPFGMLMPGRGSDSATASGSAGGNILIVYNDFSDGTTQGWTKTGGNADAILNDNGTLKTVGGDFWSAAIKYCTVVAGRSYRVRFALDMGTIASIQVSETSGGVRQVQYGTSVSGQQDYTFTAAGPQAQFIIETCCWANAPGSGSYFKIDNFRLEEIKQQPEVPPVVSDNCMTMTQPKWVTTWVDSCVDMNVQVWYNTLTGEVIDPVKNPCPEYFIPVGSGIYTTTGAVPQQNNQLTLTVAPKNCMDPHILAVEEYLDGSWQTLTSVSVIRGGDVKLTYVPRNNNVVRVTLWKPGPFICAEGFVICRMCKTIPQLKQENVLVTVCPEDKDRYRFGFNGQEKVNEWAGMGNYLDFAFRGYDSRVARFNSVDPLKQQYPWYSPYHFAGNSPISMIDVEGLEPTRPPLPGEIVTPQSGPKFDHTSGYGSQYLALAKNKTNGKMQKYWIFAENAMQFNTIYYYYDQGKWSKFFDQNAFNSYMTACRIKSAHDFRNVLLIGGGITLAAPIAIYAGTSGALAEGGQLLWQGAQWAGKNHYFVEFAKETGKEILANRGNLSNIDWFDVGLSTVTSKMGAFGKGINIIGTSYFDLTIDKGFKSGINGTKDNGSMLLDAAFESFKTVGGEIGDAGGMSNMGKDLMEVGVDQIKTELNEQMESENKRNKELEKGNLHPD